MKVWITRGKGRGYEYYIHIWNWEPKRVEKKYWIEYREKDGSLSSLHDQEYLFVKDLPSFEKEFGYIPEPGTCEKMELKIERLKK